MSIFNTRRLTPVTTADLQPTQRARRVSVTVSPGDATCTLAPAGDRPYAVITATGENHQTFTLPADLPCWGAQVTISKPGYVTVTEFRILPATDTEWPNTRLERDVVTLPPLVRQGQFYDQQDGTPVTIIEASAFRLYERLLAGEDIDPVLAQWRDEGFNLLRVWLLNTSVGHIVPAEHPDFYARLPELVGRAARFGLYLELTVFTQTQALMPALATQQAHYDQTVTALGPLFYFLEGGNEVDSHDNAFDDRLRFWKPAGATFDLCRGSNGADAWAVEPVLESVRYHSNDTNEWWRRQAHNGMEIADAFRVPCIANENTRPDRDDVAEHHRDAAAGAALLSAGSCFHSQSGKNAVVMTGTDLICARAFVAGARSVDLSQRTQPYVHRTDLEGPSVVRAYQRGTAVVLVHT